MLLIAGALLIAGCTTTQPGSTQAGILVYAGAGLKAPLDEIGPLFTQKYGINVQYTYGGAGTLVSQMNLSRKGDVFMPGSTVEFQTAKDQGLVTTNQLVAYHVPVIAVQKGNPKNITSLKDFARPGLKIALGRAEKGSTNILPYSLFGEVQTIQRRAKDFFEGCEVEEIV